MSFINPQLPPAPQPINQHNIVPFLLSLLASPQVEPQHTQHQGESYLVLDWISWITTTNGSSQKSTVINFFSSRSNTKLGVSVCSTIDHIW